MANTNLFKIFTVVAEKGSITKASEKLFISQPAITKSIKQLEEELGGKLFERKNRGVELTVEGKHIYDKVKPLLAELDGVYDYFSNVNKLKTGVLRIGTTTSNITMLLSRTINKFINKYPNINIKIVRASEESLIGELKNNELDLAVIDSEQVRQGLSVVKEFSVTYSIVGNKKFYNKYVNKPLTRENFSNLPLALIGRGHTSRLNIDSYFAEYDITLSPKYEMENYGLIMDLIKRGLAVGVVNLEYFPNELEKEEIFKLNTNFEIDKRGISVVKFNQTENNAKDVFVKMLTREEK